MCIVFLHQNNEEDDGEYKLIFAANRDEYMSRPAKPADFNPDFPDVLCGIDMEAGVQGGTWLGVSKNGKFSALTNVLSPGQDMKKSPRGRLVINYLGGNKSPLEYVESLINEDHRKYNLLTGDIDSQGKVNVAFYSNCDSKEPRILKDKTIVFSCTKLGGNWRKLQHGGKIFEEIVEKAKKIPNTEALTNSLLETLLSDTTTLFPDADVMEQAKSHFGDDHLEKYCSVKIVGIPTYGTRMQTVILIDRNNNVYFTEKSLVGPNHDKDWIRKSFTFSLNV